MTKAQRPDGLVLTSEYGYDRLRPSRRSGEIARVRRGAWLVKGTEPEDEWEKEEHLLLARCHAAAATLRCRYAFTLQTAGFLLGWPAPVSRRLQILQTSRVASGGSADLVRHHTTSLPDEDIVFVEGLPVTVPSRTAIESALGCEPPIGLALVDAALRELAAVTRREREDSIARQDVWRDRLVDMLAERGSVRYARRARAAIRFSDGLAESGQESWMRWLALSRGMPVPELQVEIATCRGLRYPDALWRFRGAKPVLAEYDGADKYRRADGTSIILDEKDRESLLTDATGGTFVRFTKRDRPDADAAFGRLLRATPLSESDLTPRPDLFLSSALRPLRRAARGRDRG
ncbi:hypothetical protein [Pseudactinotalea sp.]|uniref:hypothetical protein n=1 Tax=Pseudactinotalea sp. TaxID=1926260 RepID=UPI003B3BBDE7